MRNTSDLQAHGSSAWRAHLQGVAHDDGGAQRKATAVNGAHHCVHQVRRRLEDVGPHEVQQVHQRVLAAQPLQHT